MHLKLEDFLTVAQAADELGLAPASVRRAIHVGTLKAQRLGARTNLIPRGEVERYRREYLGTRGQRHGQQARHDAVRRLYREHYHGGRGRNSTWDEGWSMDRIADEVGYSVSRCWGIARSSLDH